jgi:hypothetical protein
MKPTIYGTIIGFVIGAFADLFMALKYNIGCQSSQLQQILGIHPICIRMYAFAMWFAIMGGLIGNYWERE